jgi:type I restriction enzyme S subunit
VTQGLDVGAPLQATGVPWFDRVPAHWGTKRLRYLTPSVTVGIVVTPSKYYEDEGVPTLRSFNVKPGAIDRQGLAFISEASNQELAKSQLREGDLVSVRTGNPGTTAVVPSEFHGANCIDLIITRRSARFDSRYLCFFMNSAAARVQFEHGSGGALQQHFNIETAKNLVVPTPPIDEQILVADHLDRVTETLDRLLNFVRDAVCRLSELRAALISAAVTGQIDVREAA